MSSPAGARILVVEDEAVVAHDLAGMVTELGYTLAGTAHSAECALAVAAEQEPDVVLMDIRLRGSADGITAATWLRERLGIPVVFLTAHTDPDTLQRAKGTEPLGYLSKPVSETELRTALVMAVHRAKAERGRREHSAWAEHALGAMERGVLAVDAAATVRFASPVAQRLLGRSAAELQGRRVGDALALEGPWTWEDVLGAGGTTPAHSARPVGASVLLVVNVQSLRGLPGGHQGHVVLLEEAAGAWRSARHDKELLHRCAGCSLMRDDQGQWVTMETLLLTHPAIAVSHGICEACLVRLYPDLVDGER